MKIARRHEDVSYSGWIFHLQSSSSLSLNRSNNSKSGALKTWPLLEGYPITGNIYTKLFSSLAKRLRSTETSTTVKNQFNISELCITCRFSCYVIIFQAYQNGNILCGLPKPLGTMFTRRICCRRFQRAKRGEVFPGLLFYTRRFFRDSRRISCTATWKNSTDKYSNISRWVSRAVERTRRVDRANLWSQECGLWMKRTLPLIPSGEFTCSWDSGVAIWKINSRIYSYISLTLIRRKEEGKELLEFVWNRRRDLSSTWSTRKAIYLLKVLLCFSVWKWREVDSGILVSQQFLLTLTWTAQFLINRKG